MIIKNSRLRSYLFNYLVPLRVLTNLNFLANYSMGLRIYFSADYIEYRFFRIFACDDFIRIFDLRDWYFCSDNSPSGLRAFDSSVFSGCSRDWNSRVSKSSLSTMMLYDCFSNWHRWKKSPQSNLEFVL